MEEVHNVKIENGEIVTTITFIKECRQNARVRLQSILEELSKIDIDIAFFMKDRNDRKRTLFVEKEMLENQGIKPYETK